MLFLLSLITVLIFSVEVQAQPVLSDIQGHWSETTIKELSEKGVVDGYPDGTFKPNQSITRAEFAKLLSKTLGYPLLTGNNFPDIKNHWASSFINTVAQQKVMNAFADGNFQPEKTLNRAQAATFFSRVLNLAKPEEKYGEWSGSFKDVPANHWAFRYIEIANKLELLPTDYKTEYHPETSVTRAEAAWMINALKEVDVTKGKVSSVDVNTGLVNIQDGKSGDPLLTMVAPETIVLRNNASASIDTLLSGDEATVIALPSGDVKFFKSFGKVTKNDLLSRMSSMTQGKLTTSQINSIVSGDWESVKDEIRGGLYNQMITLGLTPAEAESLMVQDWNYLDELSRERLGKGLSNYLNITEDFSQALLSRDVDKIKEYGKVELATAALSRLLGAADPVSENNSTY